MQASIERCRRFARLLCASLALVLLGVRPSEAQTLEVAPDEQHFLRLELPTANDALFRGDGPAFYQYTDRPTGPGLALPWEGGRYGFVRDIRHTGQGVIYIRFHEGIDIKPVQRSSRGEPMDAVHSVDDGVVAYANTAPRKSSYGRYVIVEHWWRGSPFYSLYAHLKSVDVAIGQEIVRGERVGHLGYTGAGINRRRAHVHLEINLLLSQSFQGWYEDHFAADDPNHHGIYNGYNLSGIDVASLYLTLQEDSTVTIRDILARERGFFKVVVPNEGMLDILWRYPWLSPALNAWSHLFGPVAELSSAWEITFARSGLPLRIDTTDAEVTGPVLEMFEPSNVPYQYLTNGLVGGVRGDYRLTRAGRRLVDLIARPSPEYRDPSW